MSYIIEPMPLITFLDESKLMLPRFQRKATWDKKQNFELAISIFQDYPVGVVIINQEQKQSWLLDGRQRRSALTTMRDNPVELYEWARNYIGFNKTADVLDVSNEYWDKVERYLQTEEQDAGADDADALTEGSNDNANTYGDEQESIAEEDSFDSTRQRQGLQTLLDIILMVHQNKPSGSKWEQSFNFGKYFSRLKYAPPKTGGRISPVLLRRFILDLIKATDDEYDGNYTPQNFVDFYIQNFDVVNQTAFEKEVEKRWDVIRSSIDTITRSERIFSDARIGVIRLTNATPLDAQNIFSRINKGGTQLKAEELLSAKPYWNKEVANTDQAVQDLVKDMYANLEIPMPDSIVRWDLSATLLSRIKDGNLVFGSYGESNRKSEISMDKISLGFKLISTVFQGGMSSRHVIDVEKNEAIKWESDIDVLIDHINTVFNIVLQDGFFKYLQSWGRPITKLLGNAIALEFVAILLLDWKDKKMPRFSESTEMKALRRDARILFDRLVFEYATKTWRGSGDSKMAHDIKNWRSRIVPVSEDDWKNYIEGACEGSYNGQPTTVKLLRPVLYYYYIITESTPTNPADTSFDVDHIIPQEVLANNAMLEKSFKDSLVNLALLPTKDNISKKAKKLNAITQSWLKQEITAFTGIAEEDFDKYSDLTNLNQLKEQRKKLFTVAFGTNRKATLAN